MKLRNVIAGAALLLAGALSFVGSSYATPVKEQPATALPWLKVQGNLIVRVDTGAEVHLRGVNLLRNEWVYPDMEFERAAFPVLQQWHVNLITHGFASEPIATGDAQYLAELDEYVSLAEQYGMYVILCYYYPTLNGDQPPYPGVDPNYLPAMTALVERYKTRSNVLIMLQAEPHSDWYPSYPDGESYRVTWNGTDAAGYDHAVQLRSFYDQTVAALRAVDNPFPTSHIILGSGDGYGRDISAAVIDEYGHGGPDPIQNSQNFVYSSHPYDPPTEWGYWRPVSDAGYPVLITEFGTGGQMSQSDVNTLMSEMNTRHINWTAWLLDNEGCPCLLTGNDRFTFTPSTYGTSVRNRALAEANLGQTPTPTPTPTLTPTVTPTATATPTCHVYGIEDFNALKQAYGCQAGDACYNPDVDYNHDGIVNTQDYIILKERWGRCL